MGTKTLVTFGVCALLASGCSDDGSAASGNGVTEGGSTSGGSTADTSDPSSTSASSGTTSDPGTTSSEPTSGPTSTSSGSTGSQPGDTGGLDDVPAIEDRHGVAYVTHFASGELRWFRIDGGTLAAGGSIDMGALSHDAVLDDVNDHLYVAHDVARSVEIYGLDTPQDAADPVDDPQLLGTIMLQRAPRFVRVDPYRQRAYIVQDPDTSPAPVFDLLGYDVSDPANPMALPDSPWEIPATTSLDIDPVRGVLFAIGTLDDQLYGYDVSFGGFDPLPGSPVDLRALYPQDNMSAFQARRLVADPWTNRLYAGRAQGALSELIVLEYPSDRNGPGESYGDVASLDDVMSVADGLDVDTDITMRPGILSAFEPMPVRGSTEVFMIADAWNGTAATATVLGQLGDPLGLATGCDDHEGFGCFFRPAVGTGFLRTDGAGCLDETHGIVFGTALGDQEDDPGSVVAFTYDAQLDMAELSGAIATAAFPIDAVCH